jgi:DNA polymerase
MYHPAAALHQGNLREVMLNDFRTLPAILERARAARRGAVLQPEQAPQPEPGQLLREQLPAYGGPPRTEEATPAAQQARLFD